ncbi:ExbD/TolR family protein [Prochlorococcus marinus]|uniref:ExbD/TolR family protein n=1 Tax=Prochlorococcus marinus TaxID=1219 RepID=UPI0022B43EAD|nr:biopolymer transporter ExbD [Prochlorococcus marinus]
MLYLKEEDINKKNKIDILPMIDIIFAILAFLIISSLYLTRVDTIDVDLPKASNSIKQNNKFVNISIDKLGNIFINKESIKFEDLKVKVVNLIDETQNLIVLNADKNISHGYIIDVLDVLRSIDDLKIAISTRSVN